jgi:hypothetical protein
MSDFASAAMLRLIKLGLRRQGIALSGESRKTSLGALVALDVKRQLLDGLIQQHGPAAILRIGSAVKEVTDEPVLKALTLAKNPFDLIERWRRLESFVHSRHRVEIVHSADFSMCMRHVSKDDTKAPTDAENLLILGLLAALIEMAGASDLSVQIGIGSNRPWNPDEFSVKKMPIDTSFWKLSWNAKPLHT